MGESLGIPLRPLEGALLPFGPNIMAPALWRGQWGPAAWCPAQLTPKCCLRGSSCLVDTKLIIALENVSL